MSTEDNWNLVTPKKSKKNAVLGYCGRCRSQCPQNCKKPVLVNFDDFPETEPDEREMITREVQRFDNNVPPENKLLSATMTQDVHETTGRVGQRKRDFPHCNVEVIFKNGKPLTMHVYHAIEPLEHMITTLNNTEENRLRVAKVFLEKRGALIKDGHLLWGST